MKRVLLKNSFKILFALAVLCINTDFLKAQSDTTEEEDDLYPEGFTFESDLVGNYSRGWFPTPNPGMSIMLDGYDSNSWLSFFIESAADIRSQSFKNTKFTFTDQNPFEENEEEREFVNPGSSDRDGDFPERRSELYGLTYLWNMPFPAILRGGAGLSVNTSMLFSTDNTREYLDLSGNRQPLKEVNILAVDEYLVKASAGVMIPVYGVFLGVSQWGNLGSYYYVYGGISGEYAVSSKATQYSQIANAKDALRYGNGRDTVHLMTEVQMNELNTMRYAYEAAVGWHLSGGPIAFGIEAYGALPQTSLLKDAEWKQYFIGLKLMIGYTWQ